MFCSLETCFSNPQKCPRLALGRLGRPAHVIILEALCDRQHAQETTGGLALAPTLRLWNEGRPPRTMRASSLCSSGRPALETQLTTSLERQGLLSNRSLRLSTTCYVTLDDNSWWPKMLLEQRWPFPCRSLLPQNLRVAANVWPRHRRKECFPDGLLRVPARAAAPGLQF